MRGISIAAAGVLTLCVGCGGGGDSGKPSGGDGADASSGGTGSGAGGDNGSGDGGSGATGNGGSGGLGGTGGIGATGGTGGISGSGGAGGVGTGGVGGNAGSTGTGGTGTGGASGGTRTLHVNVTGSGPGLVKTGDGKVNCDTNAGTCTVTFPVGAPVVLSAIPGSQVYFGGWSGDCTGSGNCSLTMSTDRTVTATFGPRYTLQVSLGGNGQITSNPAGIDCSNAGGTCSADFIEGTPVTLSQNPASGWAFTAWGLDCVGNGTCSVTMNGAHSVSATFDGPFDWSLASPLPNNHLSLLPGESRSFSLAVQRTRGGSLPVSLSVNGLPAGVTASLSQTSVMADGTSTVTLTASSTAVPGTTDASIDATDGTVQQQVTVTVGVISPTDVFNPGGVAIESGGATALVTHALSNGNGVLVRMDATTKLATKTLAEHARPLRGVVLETGGSTALVAAEDGVLRVDLGTSAVSSITSAFQGARGIALESGGATALVTDCGANNDCGSGRLDRVTLADGTVTTINPTLGLNLPYGVAIEPGGTSALVAENGANRLVRVSLSSGAVLSIAGGFAGPDEVAFLPDGASILLADNNALHHVQVATGVSTPIGTPPDFLWNRALAVESGGTTALLAYNTYGPGSYGATGYGSRFARVDLRHPLRSLAPARQSVDTLYSAHGVAILPGGTKALVVDCGAANCGASGYRVVRVDLTTGTVTVLASGLSAAHGIALEPGGATALVAQGDTGTLIRVSATTGAVSTIATGLDGIYDVVPEANGTTALATTGGWPSTEIQRITLADGTRTTVGTYAAWYLRGAMSLEPGGASVLVTTSAPDGVARIQLSNGAATQLAIGLAAPSAIAVESGGATALVIDRTTWGQLVRVDLATGRFTVVAPLLRYNPNGDQSEPRFVAIEAAGSALVTQGNRLLRVTNAPVTPTSVVAGLNKPSGFALTDTAALVLDCGGSGNDCTASGRLSSVDLSSGTLTAIVANGLNQPASIALESGNATALVTDCGPSNQNCASAGRLLRVTLSDGSLAQVASGMNAPDTVVVESGSSALVCEKDAGRLLRVDLGSGSFEIVANNLWNVRGVTIEPGGATALVSSDDWAIGGVRRVDLTTHAVTTVLPTWSNVDRLALEPSSSSAYVAWSNQGALGRLDLTKGGIDVLAMPLFEYVHTVHMDAAGANLYFTDVANPGTLFRVAAP